MSRIDGPTRRVIARRADAYTARFVAAIRDSLRTVAAGFHNVVTLDDLAPIMREWTRRVDGGLLNDVGQAYADAAHMTRVAQRDALVELLTANGSLVASADDTFEIPPVANQQAEDLMSDARNRLVNIGNDVWEHARGELLAGLQNGEGVPQLRDRVVGATDLSESRAQTIARTEIAGAMNAGAIDQMRQIDAPGMTKEWIAVDDGRVRAEHLEANGEKIPLDGVFSNGLEPGEDYNCRCTYGFDLPDEQLVSSTCECGDGEISLLASLVAGIDLGENLTSVCACDTGDAYATQSLWDDIQRQAAIKIEDAPIPSDAAVRKAQVELKNARAGTGRAGGEARGGSAADRRKQRLNLFKEFGGEDRGYVPCHACGLKMHWAEAGADNPLGLPRFERGKIFVKCQGGGYQLANLLPECFGCNRSRNDAMIRSENACVDSGVEKTLTELINKDKAKSGDVLEKSFKKWVSDLPQDERVAVEKYIGTNYKAINGTLRTAAGDDSAIAPRWRDLIDKVDSAISHSTLSADAMTSRGMLDPAKIFGKDWKKVDLEGQVFQQWGYASTTTDASVAEWYAENQDTAATGIVMNVFARKGSNALFVMNRVDPTGIQEYQHEVLYKRGSRFRVIADHGIEARKQYTLGHYEGDINVRVIDVELLP